MSLSHTFSLILSIPCFFSHSLTSCVYMCVSDLFLYNTLDLSQFYVCSYVCILTCVCEIFLLSPSSSWFNISSQCVCCLTPVNDSHFHTLIRLTRDSQTGRETDRRDVVTVCDTPKTYRWKKALKML